MNLEILANGETILEVVQNIRLFCAWGLIVLSIGVVFSLLRGA